MWIVREIGAIRKWVKAVADAMAIDETNDETNEGE
jgi:hypothetical protein